MILFFFETILEVMPNQVQLHFPGFFLSRDLVWTHMISDLISDLCRGENVTSILRDHKVTT